MSICSWGAVTTARHAPAHPAPRMFPSCPRPSLMRHTAVWRTHWPNQLVRSRDGNVLSIPPRQAQHRVVRTSPRPSAHAAPRDGTPSAQAAARRSWQCRPRPPGRHGRRLSALRRTPQRWAVADRAWAPRRRARPSQLLTAALIAQGGSRWSRCLSLQAPACSEISGVRQA